MIQKTNEQTKNYFLYPLNSILAHELSQKLKQHNNCQIVGKPDIKDCTECTPLADKIIEEDFSIQDLFILSTNIDVFVFEIFKANYEEVEQILDFLSQKNFEQEKKIIFVSHPLLWYNSEKKISENLAQSEIFESNSCQINDEQKEIIQRQSISFNDEDFNMRKTLPCYEKYRLLENQLITLGRQNSSIQTTVFLPGIIYGKGEDDFFDIFSNCLGADYLESYLEGNNIIPVAYVENCAIALYTLINQQVLEQELFIYNDEFELSQQSLMLKIQESFQIDTLKNTSDYNVMLKDDYLVRTLNLIFENSKIFCTNKIESIQNIDQNNSKIVFVNNKNILINFKDIFEEFIEYRDIKRTKGIVFGNEECLQKNQIFEKISEFLEINIYDPYQIIRDLQGKDLSDQPTLQNIVEQLQQYEKEKINEIYEEMLEKQQKSKKKNQEPITKENVIFNSFENPPNNILIQAIIYYLKQPLQIFKGYILRNFPKDNNQAHDFIQALHENDLRDDFNFILKIIPDTILMQESLKNHQKFGQKDPSMLLKEDQINFYERFMNWEDDNEMLTQFFLENDYHIKEIKFKKMELNTQKILDNLLDNDFQFAENQFEVESMIEEEQIVEQTTSQQNIQDNNVLQKHQTNQSLNKNSTNIQKEQNNIEEDKENMQENQKEEIKEYIEASKKVELERLERQQEKLLQDKTIALKQYLADIILPDVTEGIIEICKEKPEDPIQYLIEYLKKKQQKCQINQFNYNVKLRKYKQRKKQQRRKEKNTRRLFRRIFIIQRQRFRFIILRKSNAYKILERRME